jgi:hypothetical protein
MVVANARRRLLRENAERKAAMFTSRVLLRILSSFVIGARGYGAKILEQTT